MPGQSTDTGEADGKVDGASQDSQTNGGDVEANDAAQNGEGDGEGEPDYEDSAPPKGIPEVRSERSGRGKGGKGLGIGGAKRHRKVIKENINGITKPAILRMARRGGVKRISAGKQIHLIHLLTIRTNQGRSNIYEETRSTLKTYVGKLIRDAITYMEHGKRKTVTSLDVVYALKRQGRPIYGFGG